MSELVRKWIAAKEAENLAKEERKRIEEILSEDFQFPSTVYGEMPPFLEGYARDELVVDQSEAGIFIANHPDLEGVVFKKIWKPAMSMKSFLDLMKDPDNETFKDLDLTVSLKRRGPYFRLVG